MIAIIPQIDQDTRLSPTLPDPIATPVGEIKMPDPENIK
jgi:hypothetical protein